MVEASPHPRPKTEISSPLPEDFRCDKSAVEEASNCCGAEIRVNVDQGLGSFCRSSISTSRTGRPEFAEIEAAKPET